MITLDDDGDTIRLWQAQGDTIESDADSDVDSLYGYDSDETFLISMKSLRTLDFSGTASGIRLSKQSGYSSDPLTALAEWVTTLETYVNGSQGGGYTLDNSRRPTSYPVAITNFGWRRSAGEKFQVEWDISLTVGDVIMDDDATSTPSVSPSNTATLDGTDLHDIRDMRVSKQQQVETTPIQFADPEETLVQPNGGAIRRITIVGRVDGTESERNTFNDTMQSLLGTNNTYTYSSAFPGRDLSVVVNNFESTRSGGVTRLGEYSLELLEGVTV